MCIYHQSAYADKCADAVYWLFEPTCANARWALMRHFLSAVCCLASVVCCLLSLDQNWSSDYTLKNSHIALYAIGGLIANHELHFLIA